MTLGGYEADKLKKYIDDLEIKKKEYPVGSKERSELEDSIRSCRELLREIKTSNFLLVVN